MLCSNSAAPYMLIGSFQLQYVFCTITFGKENIVKAQVTSDFISKSDHMISCVWFLQTWNVSFQQGMKPGLIHMAHTLFWTFAEFCSVSHYQSPRDTPSLALKWGFCQEVSHIPQSKVSGFGKSDIWRKVDKWCQRWAFINNLCVCISHGETMRK